MKKNSWIYVFRLAWIPIPLLGYEVFGSALSSKSASVQTTVALSLWILWSIVFLISLIPSASLLTVYRVVVPISVVASIWSSIEAEMNASSILLLFCSAICFSISLLPSIGFWFINGSAYGDEVRIPLRAPGPLLLGPVPLAWIVVASSLIFSIIFLSSQKYVFGFIVFTIGSGLSYFSYRSLAALSQRWLVFVPAGVVLHDNMVLADPFLIRKSMIKGIGPALASTDGLDLTMSSIGMSLEVELYEPANLSLQMNPLAPPEVHEVTSFLVSPSLLAVTLEMASSRSIAVL